MNEQLRKIHYENARYIFMQAIIDNTDRDLIERLRLKYITTSNEYHRNIMDLNTAQLNRFLLESTFEDFFVDE